MAGRAGGTLSIFFLGSVAVHAAVLVALPGPRNERELPHTAALEVVLLRADALAVPPRGYAAQPDPRLPRPEYRRSTVPPRLQERQDPPVSVTAGSREMDGAALAVEPARVPERALAVPEPGEGGASIAQPAGASAAYLRSPAPSYPLASRRAGEQGTVTLRVRVGMDGSASHLTVEKSSGSPHLDAAALEAVKAWRFTPARRGAEAVESWMLVPIVFRLEG